eukprot:CAMPEP_0170387778 /NCGR_PEP_ID=MMETSP0117_2-20130122/17737_1 /TAXON_ID=400756 /ORGANISM="Durinskia baltica, Strain CSIRO CS-38" /LENGTH=604 /DNA_ID=CAMNT_0010643665 /DNA_START=34 /DNA_END=1848 /DNA_ORIENTATION=+
MLSFSRTFSKNARLNALAVSRPSSTTQFANRRTEYKGQLTEMRKTWMDDFARRRELKRLQEIEERRVVVQGMAVRLRERRIASLIRQEADRKRKAEALERFRINLARKHLMWDKRVDEQRSKYSQLVKDLQNESSCWITPENVDEKITEDLFSDEPSTTGFASKYSNFWRYHAVTVHYDVAKLFHPEMFCSPEVTRPATSSQQADFIKRQEMEQYLSLLVGTGEEREKLPGLVDDYLRYMQRYEGPSEKLEREVENDLEEMDAMAFNSQDPDIDEEENEIPENMEDIVVDSADDTGFLPALKDYALLSTDADTDGEDAADESIHIPASHAYPSGEDIRELFMMKGLQRKEARQIFETSYAMDQKLGVNGTDPVGDYVNPELIYNKTMYYHCKDLLARLEDPSAKANIFNMPEDPPGLQLLKIIDQVVEENPDNKSLREIKTADYYVTFSPDGRNADGFDVDEVFYMFSDETLAYQRSLVGLMGLEKKGKITWDDIEVMQNEFLDDKRRSTERIKMRRLGHRAIEQKMRSLTSTQSQKLAVIMKEMEPTERKAPVQQPSLYAHMDLESDSDLGSDSDSDIEDFIPDPATLRDEEVSYDDNDDDEK